MNQLNKITTDMADRLFYRSGEKATLLTVSRPHQFPVLTMDCNGTLFCHEDDGHGAYGNTTSDLFVRGKYEDFKKDDKVFVRDGDKAAWKPRYFSHANGESAYCFNDGGTSFTQTETTRWSLCIKAEDLEKSK